MACAQTIPTEVVHQIFAFFSTTIATNDPTLFPWFLGHICSGWRYIFLHMTREFWYQIHIACHWGDTRKPSKNVVRFFLERDPLAGFSFYLRLANPLSEPPSQSADHIRQILEMLVDESMRWQKVSFRIEGVPSMVHLLPLTYAKNRLPLLRKLRMRCETHGIPDTLYDAFQAAPSLNLVKISTLGFWKFDWSNLKILDVNHLGYSPQYFIPVLSQMTNLEWLRIVHAFRGTIQSSSVVLFPSLATLKCGTSWLPFFKAPTLEGLTLYYVKESNASIIVPSFLLRSSCNILRLRMKGGEAAPAIELIRHTPQITHLDLFDVVGVGLTLEQLIISSDLRFREPLACRLVSLHIRPRASSEDDIRDVLSRLILSRTRVAHDNAGRKSLRELRLFKARRNVSADAIKILVALCEEHGIHFTY